MLSFFLLVFSLVAVLAALLGFDGAAGMAGELAELTFVVCLALLWAAVIVHETRRER